MRWPQIGLGLIYVACVVVLEVVGSVGLYRSIGVTPWNPSAGLSVALAYLWGPSFAPFVVMAHTLSKLTGSLPWKDTWFTGVLMMQGLVYVAGGLYLRRWSQFDSGLRTVQDCLTLIFGAIVIAAVDTMWEVGALSLLGVIPDGHELAASWRSFVGVLVGILTVAPLVLLIARSTVWPAPNLEHLAQLVTVVVAAVIIFGYPAATGYQLFYLLFLPVLWVALRAGIVGAVLVLNVCQLAIIVGAQLRFGYLPGLAPLQTLLVVLVVTGLLVGVVVTERQASTQRLREQHAALNRALRLRSAGDTAAAIAHEINQPLTALGTYAAILDAALSRGDSVLAKETAAKLRLQCERAAAVVASVRELVSHGGLAPEQVDLAALVTQLSELHRDEFAAKGVGIIVDVPNKMPRLQLDPTQMQQALHNLLSNSAEAISATGQRGAITISARMEGGSAVVVEVRDDGPGFPQGLEALASTPFMTTKQNGSGLGLAVARSVAEAHGGSLLISPSRNGATVRLKLPIPTEDKCPTS